MPQRVDDPALEGHRPLPGDADRQADGPRALEVARATLAEFVRAGQPACAWARLVGDVTAAVREAGPLRDWGRGGNGTSVKIPDPPPAPRPLPDAAEQEAVEEMNRRLEVFVRERPADWMWLHRRWRIKADWGFPVEPTEGARKA